MKDFKRITAFVLCLVLLLSSFAFADTITSEAAVSTAAAIAVEEPTVTILSPLEKSIISSDSFLVSVKLNKAATIKVSVYEEKLKKTETVTKYVSGVAITSTAVSCISVDTTTFEAIDFKTTASYTDVLYTTPASYTSQDTIGFYSSKIENVTPGLYKVVVELIPEEKPAIKQPEDTEAADEEIAEVEVEAETEKVEPEVITRLVCIKEAEELPAPVFTQAKEKSGALSIISNLLKTLFK